MWTLAVQNSETGCYAIAACFPFEPLEKCMTFKDIFPGLWNFQEIQDFPEGVGTLSTTTTTSQQILQVSHVSIVSFDNDSFSYTPAVKQ